MPSSIHHNLLEACQQPGCPACRVEQYLLEKYISSLFYESVNDSSTRERLRSSLGFCREHGHMILDKKLGNALGLALIYQDIITTVLRELEKDTPQRIARSLATQNQCIICLHRDRNRQNIISSLLDGMNDSEMLHALQISNGLCVPHLKSALEAVRETPISNLLISIHREKLENLHTELTEFIRKNDYRFHSEGFGAEGNAWRRALTKLIGDKPSNQDQDT